MSRVTSSSSSRNAFAQAPRVGHRDQRVAAGHEERPQLPIAGGQDLVGQDAARERVVHRAEAADPAVLVLEEHAGALAEAGEVDDALAHQGAAGPIEVARDGVDHLLEPEAERAVRAHVDAGRAVERGAVGGEVGAHHLAQALGGDPRHLASAPASRLARAPRPARSPSCAARPARDRRRPARSARAGRTR